MKTVQMTLDEELILQIDTLCKEQGSSRSAFTRTALRMALKHFQELKAEETHRKAYEKRPVQEGEFNFQQSWPD